MPLLTITAPGVYEIRQDYTQAHPAHHAIVIAPGVHYVTLLLYGRIVGAGGSASSNAAIYANGNADVRIIGMGGSIRGFYANIWMENCYISRIQDVFMQDAWFRGIMHSGDDPIILGNDIRNVTGCTLHPDAFAIGIETQGVSNPGKAKVLRNIVQDVYATGSGESIGISITDKGLDAIMAGNVVKNQTVVPNKSFGLWVGGESNVAVVQNHIQGFHYGAAFSSPPTGFVDENSFKNVTVPILDGGTLTPDVVVGPSDIND
jgi:hypothetical protein